MRKCLAIAALLLCAGVAGAVQVIRMIPLYGESIPPPVMSNWPSGLIGYWGFDTTYNDRTTNNNWAEILGNAVLSSTTARVGSVSCYFDGADDFVRGWQRSYNEYTNGWTISVWVYDLRPLADAVIMRSPVGFNTTPDAILTAYLRVGGSYNGTYQGSQQSLAIVDYIRASTYTPAGTWTTADTGRWVHIAAVWSSTAANCAIYKDGVPQVLIYTNAGKGIPGVGPFTMLFGARSDGENDWKGYVDETALFNRCLTAAEIALLANPPTTNIPLPLGTVISNDDSVLQARPTIRNNTLVSDASYLGEGFGTKRTGAGNPTFATNKFYNDGGDGVRIPDKDYFSFSNTAFTLGAWLKPWQYQTTNAILTKTTAATTQREWEMYVSATNPAVSFTLYDSQSNSATWTSGNLNLDTNLWFHAAFSLDAGHQVGRWYTNGALDTCTTQTTLTAPLRNTTNAIMWMLGNGSWTPFIGWYGNFDIYTNDFPSTVTTMYNAVTGVYTN